MWVTKSHPMNAVPSKSFDAHSCSCVQSNDLFVLNGKAIKLHYLKSPIVGACLVSILWEVMSSFVFCEQNYTPTYTQSLRVHPNFCSAARSGFIKQTIQIEEEESG